MPLGKPSKRRHTAHDRNPALHCYVLNSVYVHIYIYIYENQAPYRPQIVGLLL